MKLALKITLICLSAALVLSLCLGLSAFALTKDAVLDREKLQRKDAAIAVYAKDGTKESVFGGETVRYEEMPAHLPSAFVAVEDKRFFSHGGTDFKRMAKAALKNLFSFSFREGASTISQQLIKNTHLSGEKTISRKLKEIKLARALEKNYSKQEILELYLNSIYFGHSAFGIERAANFYFGKAPKDLSPAQSAMLAALVKSPNRYSPFRAPDKCLARRNFVLSLMEEQGFLTTAEFEEAKKEPLPAAPTNLARRSDFASLALEELSALLPDAATDGPVSVYTALDSNLQRKIEEFEPDCDLSVLVLDNKTGLVKAFRSASGLIKRLPASTIKPLAVYAPALEENLISPATPILDEKVNFSGYQPENYGGTFSGYVSARNALAKSINVPAVKILNELGLDRAEGYLKRMSMPILKEDKTLALALGGMKEGFTLKQLCEGYSVFANKGVFSPASFIERVENARGELLYERQPPAKRQVFSEETCALINSMLQTAVKEGTAKKLRALPFEVCAKTGTGGTGAGNTDAYTIAYTAEDTVGVWLGNEDGSLIQETGGGLAANFALKTLQALYSDSPPENFAPCESLVSASLDKEEYEKNHRLILSDPKAPSYLTLHELFQRGALPKTSGTSFSSPKIQMPRLTVQNQAVTIILCQTYYYDYVVKRECEGQICTVYSGKYREEIVDNAVEGGKTYTYFVTPYYCGIEGETVQLPSVQIKKSSGIPDDWWVSCKLSL